MEETTHRRVEAPGRERQAAGARPDPAGPGHDVFVSYSTDDKPVADAIVSRLEQAGVRCWVAPRDVIPGMVWGEAIVRAIESSRLMIVVISGKTNRSHQVVREVERAVANDLIVVPFRIESVEPTGAMAYFLASEHWLDAMTPPLDAHIAQLVRVVHALLGTTSTPEPPARLRPAPPPPPAHRPPPPPPSRGPGREVRGAPGPRTTPPPGRRWWPPRRPVLAGLAAAVVLVVAGVIAALTLGSRGSEPAAEDTPVRDLVSDDCVRVPDEGGAIESVDWWFGGPVPVVPCDEPHDGEVVSVADAWPADAPYPGDDAVVDDWLARCEQDFRSYVGTPWLESELDVTGWFPLDETAWAEGDRQVGCVVYDPAGPLEETVAGSGR